MKLLRYGQVGQEKPGLMDEDDNIRDLSAHVGDISGDVLHQGTAHHDNAANRKRQNPSSPDMPFLGLGTDSESVQEIGRHHGRDRIHARIDTGHGGGEHS